MSTVATFTVRCPACQRLVEGTVEANSSTDLFTGDLLVTLSPIHDHACPARPPVPEENT